MLLYRRRWGMLYLPVLATAVAAIVVLATVVMPLPPAGVTLAVGVPLGGYAQAGERYRPELESMGVATDLLISEPGAVGPLQRLADPADAAQAGFAHGLLAGRGPQTGVQALAVVGRQPLWVFTHHTGITSLAQLHGLRIAAGPADGPTREVAQLLLGPAAPALQWSPLQGLAAADALLDHAVDAVFAIGSSDAPSVRVLAHSPGIHLVGLDRANALGAREPRLRPFVLPQGAIELRGNVPPRDLILLSTATHLLVRHDMHPALQRALLDAATEVHGMPSFLQQQAEFPDYETDFPLSPVAQRHAVGDRPWLETVLPYGWAQLAALMLYGVLPVLLAAALALLWIPRLFSLRVNAALAHYYGELKFMERDLDSVQGSPITLKPMLQRLDQMEVDVAALDLPDSYAERWYTLREHLVAARERLLGLRGR
jgi:TRAP-type uncharacterized transport system substrate-binding protein